MFEWDESKRRSNLTKHGVDFQSVWEMDWERAIRLPDGRHEYGEIRFIALAPIKRRLHVCVYTPRDEFYRIISLRKANPRERKWYDEEIDQ